MKISGIVASCILSCAASVAFGASTADIGTTGQVRKAKVGSGTVCTGDSKVMGNGDKDSAVNIGAGAGCSSTSVKLPTSQEAQRLNADRSSSL